MVKYTHILLALSVVSGALLSLTQFYGAGYVIFIIIGAVLLNFISAFSSYFSRLVLSGLLLAASVMLSGFLVLPFDGPLHPILVIGVFSTIVLVIYTQVHDSAAKKNVLFDKGDFVSIILAIAAPVVLFSSFSLSAPGIFQIAEEGWDNGSHVLMLEDASAFNRYLYGPYESMKEILITKSNAYPQAWHLATANIVEGFGNRHLLDPSKPIQTMYVYVAIITTWMVIASYCFIKASWHVATRFTKRRLDSKGEITLFILVNLLFQMVVIWGAFVSGFSNFIGMLAYLSILTVVIIDGNRKNTPALLSMAFVFATSGVLCWFLPTPALLLSAALLPVILFAIKRRSEALIAAKRSKRFLVLAASLVLLCALQIAIFVLFSTTDGADQLNAGVATDATEAVNGVFHVSQLFFVAIAVFCSVYWTRCKRLSKEQRDLFLLSTVPYVALVVALYFYQLITANSTSYYLPKLMGTALIPLGIFTAAAFSFWTYDHLRKYLRLSAPYTLVAGVLILGIVMIGSNQSTYGLSKLLERNARVGRPAAQAVVHFLRYGDQSRENVIIFRGRLLDRPYEDRNGKFESRVVHRQLNCSYRIIASGLTIDERVRKLGECADSLEKKGRSITVITSDRTKKHVKELNRTNIIIRNTVD